MFAVPESVTAQRSRGSLMVACEQPQSKMYWRKGGAACTYRNTTESPTVTTPTSLRGSWDTRESGYPTTKSISSLPVPVPQGPSRQDAPLVEDVHDALDAASRSPSTRNERSNRMPHRGRTTSVATYVTRRSRRQRRADVAQAGRIADL